VLGGRSTLLHYADVADAGIEITKAHPGSLPQFITGRSTLLSNLFRDEVALRTARIAAERLTAKNVELRTARGLDTVRLGVGLASWRIGGLACTAPVLLRPLGIRRHHSDFELKLHGSFTVNPELVRALRTHFGIELDGQALAALAYEGGVFKPQPVIDHIRALAASIDSFTVHPRLVVSTFADVGAAMARDAVDLDQPVLNALAGHHDDRENLTIRREAPGARSSGLATMGASRRRPTRCFSTRMPSRRACSHASPRGIRSPSTRCPAPAARRPSSTRWVRSCATASACSW